MDHPGKRSSQLFFPQTNFHLVSQSEEVCSNMTEEDNDRNAIGIPSLDLNFKTRCMYPSSSASLLPLTQRSSNCRIELHYLYLPYFSHCLLRLLTGTTNLVRNVRPTLELVRTSFYRRWMRTCMNLDSDFDELPHSADISDRWRSREPIVIDLDMKATIKVDWT